MALQIEKGVRDLEMGLTSPSPSTSATTLLPSPSPAPSPTTAPALVLSNSGKRIDQLAKKKYVKQVTGRHNDTELHIAAKRGDLAAVRQILREIDAQMTGTASGADFDAEVAEIRSAMVNEVNEIGETALFAAAERGFLDVVVELLKYSDRESIARKNRSGYDALLAAAKEGHRDVVQVLLDHDPTLSKTFGPSNTTPLIQAASRGHNEVVNLLLEQNSSLIELSRDDGKNSLHLAARQGFVDIVKALLDKDPQLARRTDKKGQTALHMAVKGTNCDVVKALVEADPALVMLPDKFGNTALHVATRKHRAEIVRFLLLNPDICVNALTRDHKTAYDIAERFPLSEESADIKECLARYGAVRANELNHPRNARRKTVTVIKEEEMEEQSNALEIEDGNDSSWVKNLTTNVNKRRGRDHSSGPCTIFKVPMNIRKCNPDAYTPFVVSIGPYHHNSSLMMDSNFKAMENHKWLCLRRLLFRHRSRRMATGLLGKCFSVMKSLDAKVRCCYSESLDEHCDVHRLALIMLLDGCFILHLLLERQSLTHHVSSKSKNKDPNVEDKSKNKDDDHKVFSCRKDDGHNVEEGELLLELGDGEEEMEEEPLLRTLWIWNFVLYDLLKLENQIPFFVLTTLFDLLKAPDDKDVHLVNLAVMLFSDVHPSKSQNFPILPAEKQVYHLLHLFHSSLFPSMKHDVNIKEAPEWIPTATELQQAGVKFVKKTKVNSFLDISFNSNGTMEIPELCLYDYTDTLFRNLIAFEQCYPDTRTYITIYAAFMDSLIDSPKDVRLLHLKKILTNRLGTDEAAADLFNKLCYQIHYASHRNYLHGLFADVNKYYESRGNQWRAKLRRDYFSNPWAIISLMAAVLLLLLTIEQSFFTAYSYFRPS